MTNIAAKSIKRGVITIAGSPLQMERGIRDSVRFAMSCQNVTVHALARRAGVPRSSLIYWLRAERRIRSTDLCKVLASLGADFKVHIPSGKPKHPHPQPQVG